MANRFTEPPTPYPIDEALVDFKARHQQKISSPSIRILAGNGYYGFEVEIDYCKCKVHGHELLSKKVYIRFWGQSAANLVSQCKIIQKELDAKEKEKWQ